jgi:GntR family transcriptional regulator, transcriptional repressor for pyruvate dehydrogenase complex
LREAVRALSLLGVLSVRQGDGTYVTSLEPQVLLEATRFVVDFIPEHGELELIQARLVIEPAAVEAAVPKIRPWELRLLRKLLKAIDDQPTPVLRLEADAAFHTAIVVASGNEVLAGLVRSVAYRTREIHLRRAAIGASSGRRAQLEHAAIYRACAAGDAELAKRLTAAHIATSESWLRSMLGDKKTRLDGASNQHITAIRNVIRKR